MKKSCLGKESKVVTTKDFGGVLNDHKEENLTEEQIYINKKLSESGIEDEDLGWLEKKNICKTINVSLNTAGSDRFQRSSPRLSKTRGSRAAKWVENSFEDSKKADTIKNLDNETSLTTSHSENSETDFTLARNSNSSPLNIKASQQHLNLSLKSNNRREFKTDAEVNGDSPKAAKRVHYVKIQVEGSSKEECTPGEICCKEEDSKELVVGKKRGSGLQEDSFDSIKKLKMEETYNKVPFKEESPLKLELDFEKRKCGGTSFVVRDVKSIVSECEFRNKKWKETFAKYKCPARWGIPIVMNCSEKWDGKRIPSNLLHRYQKYLSSNNLSHPIFSLTTSQSGGDLNKFNSEMSSQSSTSTIGDNKDDLGNEFKDTSESSLVEDELSKSAVENNLNASTSDGSRRMVLRNRNQQKQIVIDDDDDDDDDNDDYSSDGSDEWPSKKKFGEKDKINSKNKKAARQNKQLVLKLEKCNINKKSENDQDRKTGNMLNGSYGGGTSLRNNSMMPNNNLKSEAILDTVVCPICSLRFKKQLIENHATECASKTYKD